MKTLWNFVQLVVLIIKIAIVEALSQRGKNSATVRLTNNDSTPQEVHMEVFKGLVTSRRVWLAFLALVVTVLGVAYPQLPPSVVQAAQTFAVILIAAFTIDDTAATIKGS